MQRKATKSIFTEGEGEEGEEQYAIGEVKRNKLGKKAKRAIQQKREKNNPTSTSKEKQFTKLGKEIVYSASPGRHFTKQQQQQTTPSSTLLKNE